MKNKTFKLIGAYVLTTAFFMPLVAFAAPANFKELIMIFLDIINDLVRFVMVLALLFFLFNVFKLVFANGDEKSIEEAKTFMFYGIIALFVMVSVWGLVNILTATLFGGSFIVPQLR
jgi:fumarate reductase subunit D